MAEVPVSIKALEDIVVRVAESLLEQWAIDDRFTEDEVDLAKADAIEDVTFVINLYMQLVNETIQESQIQSSAPKLIV